MLPNYSFAGPGAYGITAIVVGAIGYLVIRWKVHFGFLFGERILLLAKYMKYIHIR
jgi:hypothetical protein